MQKNDAATLVTLPVKELPALVLLVHHPTLTPSEAEWEHQIKTLLEVDARSPKGVRQLVFTDGVAPTAKQRKYAADASKKAKTPKIAVVSSSTMVRGAVTAMSWMGVDISSFGPTAVADALKFLGYHEGATRIILPLVISANHTLGATSKSTSRIASAA